MFKNKFVKIFFWIFTIILGVHLLLKGVFALIPYPELDSFKNQKYSTRFYDRKDNLIFVKALDDGLKREFTPLEKIPENVQKLFICAEDKRFYHHTGVDFVAALSAFFQNKSAGRTVRGASTITMQLVKMMPGPREYSFKQKLKDVLNAWRIEAKLSKKEILELYLNSVPFGHSCEGVTSAARLFYDKEIWELSDFEAASLSVIPRRPVNYDPTVYPERNANRAVKIFQEVIKVKEEDLEALATDLLLTAEDSQIYGQKNKMPHYMNYLISDLKKKNFDFPYEYKTTVDLEVYNVAQNYLRTSIRSADKARIANASLLLIDNRDNSIITWIGNYDWYDSQHSGQIDGILVRNQPGSSMKPFLYALALDSKNINGVSDYTPATVFADVPKEFGNQNLYIPSNFNNRYNGPVRLRIALASSLNVPAVDLLHQIGVQNYLKKLKELGFNSLDAKGLDADLGLALGAGEVTLYELVNGFSVFPKKGIGPEGNRVFSEDTAALICSILSDKGARALGFGYEQTFQTDYPSIFKTGTSNQYQDIVALGATPRFTIGVWMGNFKGQTVRGKTGSSLPASVAKNVLDYLTVRSGENVIYDSFDEPEGWNKQKICSLSGLKPGPYCTGTVLEYVQNNVVLEECDWHQKKDGNEVVVYPSEYQVWKRLNTFAELNYSSSKLEILTPKENSIFYHSEMNQEIQALSVEVIGGFTDKLKIEYDGKPYKEINRPFKFNLPVEPGKHNLTVICDDEKVQRFFEVL